MFGMFIADTDGENIEMLCGFLAQKYTGVPDVWRNSRRYHEFLDETKHAIVLIRVDNCAIPGLELTQAATARGADIHSVWMAESDAYAVEAFRYGAEAYLLLPATEETLWDTINSLKNKSKRNLKGEELYEE